MTLITDLIAHAKRRGHDPDCGMGDGCQCGYSDLMRRVAHEQRGDVAFGSIRQSLEVTAAIEEACSIIETGDQRLLASDGPAGNQPPDISLTEWRRLYVLLDGARRTLRRRHTGDTTNG